MKNDKKRMLLAGVLALSVLTGCSSASAASATSSMAASMAAVLLAAASPAASSEVVSQPETAEGVVLPIAQGSLEEIKTGSYQFAADITSVDAKKRQMDMTVYAYDSYRAEDIDGLEAGKAIRIHPDGAVEAQDLTVESIERNEETGIVSINGGIEQGGVDLWRSNDIYRTVTYDDYPVYYMVGELVLPMDENITLSDSSSGVDAASVETDGTNGVASAVGADLDSWTEYNTTVSTTDGKVSNILRIWVP